MKTPSHLGTIVGNTPRHFSLGSTDMFLNLLYIIKIQLHSSCEIEDFVETHLCKLSVILRSRIYSLETVQFLIFFCMMLVYVEGLDYT